MDATTKGAGTTYNLEVERGQIRNVTAKGAGTTYNLEVERECNGVISRMRLQKEQEQRTNWRWRGSAMGSDHGCECKRIRDEVPSGGGEGWGQITDATAGLER